MAAADDSGLAAELKLKDGTDPQEVLERLMRERIRLRRFERIEPSLKRIFLDKAGPDAVEAERRETVHA